MFHSELFILPGMTDVGLNCKRPQLYIHCLDLQSINAFWGSTVGDSLLPPPQQRQNGCSWPPQSLHYFARTCLTPDVRQESVFKWDFLEC